MSSEQGAEPYKWLVAEGNARCEAVRKAARFLLKQYLEKWAYLIPVELHRLAATANAEIVRMQDLNGDAILMPVRGGFQILVNAAASAGRYRTSVAHELVHTLFYTIPEQGAPRRAIPHNQREESFCFDVARHLLVPQEHLEAIGVLRESDVTLIFNQLTRVLLLSRPWAARVMLADYALARGIAGRWIRTAEGWKQEKSAATATPSLSREERANLRKAVAEHLESPEKGSGGLRIVTLTEQSGAGVFVIAAQV